MPHCYFETHKKWSVWYLADYYNKSKKDHMWLKSNSLRQILEKSLYAFSRPHFKPLPHNVIF